MASNPKSYFDLVPYQKKCLLNEPASCLSHLNLLKFIIEHLNQALFTFYHEKYYEKFDAHVGDTMCQIRAIMLFEFASNPNINEVNQEIHRLQNLGRLLDNIIEQSSKIKYDKNNRFQKITLEEFFTNHHCDLKISDTCAILLFSYVLSIYKKPYQHFESRIDINSLSMALGMGKTATTNLVHYFQKSLAAYSVSYILAESKTAADCRRYFVKKDSLGRELLPCYLISNLIHQKLKKLAANVLLIVRNAYSDPSQIAMLTFKLLPNKCLRVESVQMPQEHYFVLNCYSHIHDINFIKSHVQSLGPMEIFQLCSANHIQFSPQVLDADNDAIYQTNQNDPEINSHDMRVLEKNYHADKQRYQKLMVKDKKFLCELQHVSMGTVPNHQKLYQEFILAESAV